jgi:hypothetical protein
MATAPLLVLTALAASAPMIDLPTICRSEQLGVAADRQARVYQDCIHDEQAARDELLQNWTQYPVATRATCAELGQLVVSYVEVLVCIEIKNGVASSNAKTQLPQESPAP